MKSIFKRYAENPVLSPEDMPGDCFAVYNGGAVKINGEYIALVRTEDSARYQRIWCARSRDGYRFTPDPEPVKIVADDMDEYLKYAKDSFFDPRINVVEGKFYVTYAAYTFKYGSRIGLGVTEDFKTIRHIGFPLHVLNRNAVLFPEKIDGLYVMLHRPEGAAAETSGFPALPICGSGEIARLSPTAEADDGTVSKSALAVPRSARTAAGWSLPMRLTATARDSTTPSEQFCLISAIRPK